MIGGPMEKSDGGIASAAIAPAAAISTSAWERCRDYFELTKPRIGVLVLLVTAVGFCLGSAGAVDLLRLCHALIGTALVAAGANTLNQYIERRQDRLMRRTAGRPIPSGRIRPSDARSFGIAISIAGAAYLLILTNGAAALLAIATSVLYLFVYTPLKRRTIYNTMVGAVPGALPPLIGFAAASGRIDLIGWALFGVLFVWQLPHFFAIAWVYRDDYSRGGYRMLSSVDADGRRTGRWVVGYSALLVAVSLTPAWVGFGGSAYAIGAFALGGALLGIGLRMRRLRTIGSARLMVAATVAYLPLLMLMLLLDRLVA